MTVAEAQETFLAWQQLAQQLEALKARELELRLQVAEFYFPEADDEGSTSMDLGEGWKLTLVKRVNRSMANSKGETDAIVKQLPPEVAEKVVGWKPELKLREYRKLAPEYRAVLDSVVTTRPGTPALKLVPPKEDK